MIYLAWGKWLDWMIDIYIYQNVLVYLINLKVIEFPRQIYALLPYIESISLDTNNEEK